MSASPSFALPGAPDASPPLRVVLDHEEPPPLPEVIALGHARRLAAQRAARAAWVAPVAGVCLAIATLAGRAEYPVFRWIIDGASALFLVTGLVCGIVALVAIRRVDRPGVAVPAVAGICISVMLMVLTAATLNAVRQVGQQRLQPLTPPPQLPAVAFTAIAAPQNLAEHVKPTSAVEVKPASPSSPHDRRTPASHEDIEKYGGWYGAATAGPAVLTVMQMPDDAPATKRLLSALPFQVTAFRITLDNSRGSTPITLDPSSLRAESTGGHKLAALPARSVLETARPTPSSILAQGREIHAEPGERLVTGLAFFVPGAEFRSVNRITLTFNGRRVALAGRYVPPDTKLAAGGK